SSRPKKVSSQLPQSSVIFKHGLKNALIPVLTLLGVRVSQLIGGSVIVESIFNIQGLGQTVVRAALSRDIPVVLGITVFTSIIVLVISIALDLVHPILNPKLRHHR
ncbi:MAG TPA: ABC transporter permease, partial [Ilumatobacteraceae bacterium]|nr:ABC transporter permease [Ilumatobacteraceae bacterium]